MDAHNWCKTSDERIEALVADIAKQGPMLDAIAKTIKQLQAKNAFQLALLHQEQNKENK